MNELGIVYHALQGHRGRNLLLLVTIAIAFFIYGVLGTLRLSLNSGEDDIGESRLIVIPDAGLTQSLPIAYRAQLQAIDGVADVGYATWVGAYYQSQKQMLMMFAVEPAVWLKQHPDMIVAPEAARRFLATNDGMLVAEALARHFNWKVGDVVPLKSIIFYPRNGEAFWPVRLSGTFRSTESGGGRNYIVMHYDYLNTNRAIWQNTVGSFMVTARDGVPSDRLAAAIDEHFASGDNRTTTATDRAFHAEFFAQFANITLLIRSIVAVSFASMLFIVASTLTVTIRQRTRDIGVLKVLGFSNRRIARLVFGETMTLMAIGSVTGIVGAAVAVTVLTRLLPATLPDIALPVRVLLESGAMTIAVGLVAGALPMALALRMKAVETLSHDQ